MLQYADLGGMGREALVNASATVEGMSSKGEVTPLLGLVLVGRTVS
jgi:hypothetical protein